ncbi:MAG: DUF2851 family protein [Dehalococcoidia bacterium]
MSSAPQPLPASERDLTVAWSHPGHGPLRLEDGSTVRVIFPGVPAGGRGPDFQGAILDINGDLVRGDVELHLLASGWFAHRHHQDPAYRAVVLHAVAANDSGVSHTPHSGRRIPLLVLPPPAAGSQPPPFTPPCALEAARGAGVAPVLQRLGHRRLRARAATSEPLVRELGYSGALLAAMLRVLGGPANGATFARAAYRLPLEPLLERASAGGSPRPLAIRAELGGAIDRSALTPHAGRPAASPGKRLDLAARLVHVVWPGPPAWPFEAPSEAFPLFRRAGASRALSAELAVNAALPVSLAARVASDADILAALDAIPSPGTYGRLRLLEGWLSRGQSAPPFRSASALQGGLALHLDYCTRGFCGRCPLSSGPRHSP